MDWSQLIDRIEESDSLPEEEKTQGRKSFQSLKTKLFGDEEVDVVAHPLLRRMGNIAPWNLRWAQWFASTLKELQSHEGYGSLESRIRDPEQAREAMTVVEVAADFLEQGYDITVEPDIERFPKEPDLLIKREDRSPFVIEVTEIRQHREERKSTETVQRVSAAILKGCNVDVPLRQTGRIHKSLAEPHLSEVEKAVLKLAAKASEQGKLLTLEKPRTLELALAPEEKVDPLSEWAHERDLEVGRLEGPTPRVDHLDRIGKQLNWKQDQLPEHIPGIVVLVGSQIFLRYLADHSIALLEEELFQHEKTVFAVVKEKTIGKGRFIDDDATYFDEHIDDHRLSERRRFGMLFEQFLVLQNRYHEHDVVEDDVRAAASVVGAE